MWVHKTVSILILLTFFSSSRICLPATEHRTALVIGNGTYNSSPLKNPVNDATCIVKALRKLGFKVLYEQNASLRDMDDAIRRFGKHLKKNGGVGLFYYAGHGMQIKGRNYLIPVDADIGTESDTKYEAVDAGWVLGKMEDAGNPLNIVILDACRDNPFARSFRSVNHGLARMDAPTGTIVAYATSPGSIAADGAEENGLYTSMLLKHIRTPGLRIESFFKRVRVDVINESGNKQVPWESSSLTGNFCFNPGRGIAVRPKPYTKAKYLPAKNERMDNSDEKAVAYVGPFTLKNGEPDENLREMLRSLFSQSSEKFKLSAATSVPDHPDIVIEGKVLSVVETKIIDKEAREQKQAAAMMSSILKGFSKMSGESENPLKTLKIPVPETQDKVLVKVRVLVNASYPDREAFYSQVGVAEEAVHQSNLDEVVKDLTAEAAQNAAVVVYQKLNGVKLASPAETQIEKTQEISKSGDLIGSGSSFTESDGAMHREW